MIERAAHPTSTTVDEFAGGACARRGLAGAALLAASCAPALRPPVETGKRAPDLVEIVDASTPPSTSTSATPPRDNFVGRPVYKEARAFLQRPAAEALVRAHRALAAKGYGLLVFDGYRPWSVTKLFWDVTPARQDASSWPTRARARATTAAARSTSPSTTSPPAARSRCRAPTTR